MRKWWPLVAVCLGTFMLLIDVTIVNVALPAMARSLSTSFASLQWVVDAYALALAALLLGIGSIADLVGHRRAYLAGLALFAVASLVCGLAPDAAMLITARAVQGIGAAAMFATTFALLNSSYQGRDRGTAYGLWGAVSGASAAIGPIIGGLLTEGISWRWIFFVNLPVSVLAIALSLRVLPVDRPVRERHVDVAGMVLFTIAAAALTFGLIRANEDGWANPRIYGLLVISALALATFVLVQARSRHAMLDLELFGNRAFLGTLIAALLLNFAAFAYFTYTSIWLQSVLGLSPIQAGLTGLPLSIASFAVSAGIGRYLHRGAPGPIIGTGMILIGLGAVLNALLVGSHSSWPALVPGFVIVGAGVGLATPTLSSSAMAAVAVERGGMAAGTINTARQLGFAIGIAVLGTFFATRAGQAISDTGRPGATGIAHALAGGQAQGLLAKAGAGRPALDATLRTAAAAGLDVAFWVAGIAGIAAGLAVLVLVRPARPAEAAAALAPAALR